ncbi:MAG: hypothetical protein QXF56_01035 [Candidatus Micrarchaeia archaeon]
MEMKKGFGGLLVLSVFTLGFILLLSSHSPRIASKGYSSIVFAEVRSNRIALARKTIIESYKQVNERNLAEWTASVEKICSSYGLRVSIDFSKTPKEVKLTDSYTGMSSSFFLT